MPYEKKLWVCVKSTHIIQNKIKKGLMESFSWIPITEKKIKSFSLMLVKLVCPGKIHLMMV